MKSYILSLFLKFLLPKGLDWLESAEINHQAEIDAWFEAKFPGYTWLGLEKALVHKAIPMLIEQAKLLVKNYADTSEITEEEILNALSMVAHSIFA